VGALVHDHAAGQHLHLAGVEPGDQALAIFGWDIDVIHWDTGPVWISLIVVDTGGRRSAQLQHVVGKLKDRDPAPRPVPAPSPDPPPAEDHPGIGIMFAN
jgi:hypothetical protein